MTFVLGYDDSPSSRRALEVAIELADRFDEPLVVVYGAAPPGGLGEEYRAHQQALMGLGATATAAAVERATAAGVSVEAAVVPAKPDRALLDTAEARNARMLVVGAHDVGPVRAAILGTTAQRVLNQADRPVLVV